MIKNEKQYKISKKTLAELGEKIAKMKSDPNHGSLKQKLVQGSLEDFKKDIEKEIKEYETLKSSKSSLLRERSLSDLPSMIIEFKIAHRLTHKEFSKLLGLKEQQLQRYEAQGFKTVSFQNLIKLISMLDFDVRVKEIVIKPKRNLRAASTKDLSKT